MEDTINQRLKTFISYKGISIREFERVCGLSNGYVSGIKHVILPEKMANISLHFPDLNTVWLLTGHGEMLIGGDVQQSVTGHGNTAVAGNGNTVSQSDSNLSKALDEISEQRKLINKSQEQIDRLLSIIERMQRN